MMGMVGVAGTSRRGIENMFMIVVGIVAMILVLVIVFMIYTGASKSIAGVGTIAGSAQVVGTQGLTITMTASGGKVVITQVNIIGPSGNILMTLPGSIPSGCTLALYNDTGQYNAWGTTVIPAGKYITINLFGTCRPANAREVHVVSAKGNTTMIPVSS